MGRPKGSKNRRTLDIEYRLEELGCDPIEGMARIAMDESNPIDLRARMYRELAQYVAPKRRAVVEELESIRPTITVVTGISGAPGSLVNKRAERRRAG